MIKSNFPRYSHGVVHRMALCSVSRRRRVRWHRVMDALLWAGICCGYAYLLLEMATG